MKHFLPIIALLGILIATPAHSALQPYAFPFIGRWQPSEAPELIDKYGLQDIQNLRKDGKHFKGVQGHTIINTGVTLSGTTGAFTYPISGFHFKKENPTETHIFIQATNESGTSSAVFHNKAVIPNTGNFETDDYGNYVFHSDAANADVGRFSIAPQDNVVYCNQQESLIWGGEERHSHGFLVYNDKVGISDQWPNVWKNESDTYVTFTGGATTFYVGSTRRINKIKYYIKTANTNAGSSGVSRWNGWRWEAVAGFSDATASGGKPLAVSGSMTWTYSSDDRTTFVEDYDELLYWYQVQVSSLLSATEIYWVTVAEGGFRPIENIWDGTLITIPQVWLFDTSLSAVSDVSEDFGEDYGLQEYDVSLDSWTSADIITLCSLEPLRGFEIKFVNNKFNANSSAVTVQYHNGTNYSGVTGLYDGTRRGAATFAQNGRIHWLPIEEWEGVRESKVSGFSTEVSLYTYRVKFSANLDAEVRPYYMRGIPAQPANGDYKDIGKWRFPLMYQNRLWLFCESDEGNKAIYSADNAPDVFNGDDSGEVYLGDGNDIVAAGVIYNLYKTVGYEQIIAAKGRSTFRIFDDEGEYSAEQLNGNIGCAAPLSFVVCEAMEVEAGIKRHIAAWQSGEDIVVSDGATVQSISKDVRIYWDSNALEGLASRRINDTVAWYDPNLFAMKVLLSSGDEKRRDTWGDNDTWFETADLWGYDWGSAVSSHNTELEYSFEHDEWTKIYREDGNGSQPLQIGFQVHDTDNAVYTYGVSNDGYMCRLENGNSWNGTAIEQSLRTGSIFLDEGNKPFFNHTTINYIRLLWKQKSFQSGETLQIEHWGDGFLGTAMTKSIAGVSEYVLPDDIDMSLGTVNTQDVFLGPCLRHSFEFSCTTTDIDDGMELLGLGIYFEPESSILGVN